MGLQQLFHIPHNTYAMDLILSFAVKSTPKLFQKKKKIFLKLNRLKELHSLSNRQNRIDFHSSSLLLQSLI